MGPGKAGIRIFTYLKENRIPLPNTNIFQALADDVFRQPCSSSPPPSLSRSSPDSSWARGGARSGGRRDTEAQPTLRIVWSCKAKLPLSPLEGLYVGSLGVDAIAPLYCLTRNAYPHITSPRIDVCSRKYPALRNRAVISTSNLGTSNHHEILSTSHRAYIAMSQPSTFSTIPILPLSAALSASTKPQFLASLRDALLNVGFLYLSDLGLSEDLLQDVVKECVRFFQELPEAEKERIEMKNEKSFLGWSRVSCIYFFC
jgi:hypothetical protein